MPIIIKDWKDVRLLTKTPSGHLIGIRGDQLERFQKAMDTSKRLQKQKNTKMSEKVD